MGKFARNFLYLLFYFCLFIYILARSASPATAADFSSNYKVEYFLSETGGKLTTKVRFTVAITNFRTDVFVKQFSVAFPNIFTITNIKAADDHGLIHPVIEKDNEATKISLEFSNPKVGKNSKGSFYLDFDQENLFLLNGNVWEVIIPTVENKKEGSYEINVHLPTDSTKKIAISKPKPDNISDNTVSWRNPKTKTIYAVFGDTQYYQTDLNYNLKNEKLLPVYTDIAFPPDTLYQKVAVEKINPKPAKIFTDEDGNFLARYFLRPRESKTVNFIGTVTVFAKPREDILPVMREMFTRQKKYLLNSNKYWRVNNSQALNSVTSDTKSIFDFTVQALNYNYKKIDSGNARLGAEAALKNPANAVCMEFTDLFLALARNRGVHSREIEGYGFSQDPKLRPLSLVSDILHSWPEYYDSDSQLWIQLDPTWEDTSGIDYFSAFDLNHIAFVIHGKEADYPYPAGTYKTTESKDLTIKASKDQAQEKAGLVIKHDPLPNKINDNKTYRAEFTLTNAGNVFLWLKPPEIETKNLKFGTPSQEIFLLAPYESKTVVYDYSARAKNVKTSGYIKIKFPYNQGISAEILIVPYYYELALTIGLGLSFFAGIAVLIFLLKKAKNSSKL